MSDELQPTPTDDANTAESTPQDGQENKQDISEEKEPGPQKYRVKVSGEEREVTADEMVRDYQLKEESFKRMKEATTLMKRVKPFVERIQKGDLSVLKEFGVSQDALRDFSEKELRAYIEEQEMPEPERNARKAKQEAEKYRKELESHKKREQEAKKTELASKAAQDIESEFIKVFEANKIPVKGSQRLMRQMAEYMFNAIEHGNAKITAQEAYDIVSGNNKRDYTDFMKKEFTSDPEKFIKSLPAEIVDGIRKYEIKKVRGQMPSSTGYGSIQSGSKDSKFRDWMKKEINKW